MITVTKASEADAETVHSVMKAAFAEHATLAAPSRAGQETVEDVRGFIVNKGGAILAWKNGKAIGTARYQLYPDYVYVGRVGVLPESRGLGVGKLLMAHIEQIALEVGRPEIRLGTRKSLPGNAIFYQKLGYSIFKIEPYAHGPDEVVWLHKNLG
jgi:ribosomal protein S18 acetylase RimI-like enzyme